MDEAERERRRRKSKRFESSRSCLVALRVFEFSSDLSIHKLVPGEIIVWSLLGRMAVLVNEHPRFNYRPMLIATRTGVSNLISTLEEYYWTGGTWCRVVVIEYNGVEDGNYGGEVYMLLEKWFLFFSLFLSFLLGFLFFFFLRFEF